MSSRKPAPPMAPTRQSPGSSSNTGASNSDVSSNTATARLRNLSLEASQTTSKDPEPKQWADINENLIGGKSEYDGGKELAKRGKNNFYTKGKGVNILINCYRVQSLKTTTVYQYNVKIGNGKEKRGLIMAVWNSQPVQAAISHEGVNDTIYDGNHLAWSKRQFDVDLRVDMDQVRGRTPRAGHDNIHTVQISRTKQLDLGALDGYIDTNRYHDTDVIEAISFLNHLIRFTPSANLISLGRSFFSPTLSNYRDLEPGLMACRGIFQSLRAAEGGRCVINVHVSNTSFWKADPLLVAAVLVTGERQNLITSQRMNDLNFRHKIQRLTRLKIQVEYQGIKQNVRESTFVIKKILPQDCRSARFLYEGKGAGADGKISVLDYFRMNYNYAIRMPQLPVVETTRGALYPMECCRVTSGQRYPFKLNGEQLNSMILFAATTPAVRYRAINAGLQTLDWAHDPQINNYGMNISLDMITTVARLLPPPAIEFGNGPILNPQYTGRWDLKGKKFWQANNIALTKWGVVILNHIGTMKVRQPTAIRFFEELVNEYRKYGGNIPAGTPAAWVVQDVHQGENTISNAIKRCLDQVAKFGSEGASQLIFVVVAGDRKADYDQIKRSCDCTHAVVSQVLKGKHVNGDITKKAQYIGNVLMKVNAKLGGASFKSVLNQSGPKITTHLKLGTLIIGADVSHPGSGLGSSSIAAVTVSTDGAGVRYAGAARSNGHRVEMIAMHNWEEMCKPIFQGWMRIRNGGELPNHVIYLRDGVSEGQYQHVLQQEVRDIQRVWAKIEPTTGASKKIKYTVAIGSKRHHIRFFRKVGGKNEIQNPQPGTLVERDVTNPDQWDFYLCAHSAVGGVETAKTVRPIHYHVLRDDGVMSHAEFIDMIYAHSYQYIRSTTSISQHPAIQYAHLISKRGTIHERLGNRVPRSPSEELELEQLVRTRDKCDREGKILTETAQNRLAQLVQMEHPKLEEVRFHLGSMWYV